MIVCIELSLCKRLLYTVLFHRRTRASYVYNGCLAWYNVVLTPRVHSSVKYSQLRQTDNISDVNDHAHTPTWLYSTLDWYVELTNTSYHTRHPLYTYRPIGTYFHHTNTATIVDDYDDSLLDWTHVDKLDCDQRAVCLRRENFVTPARDRGDSCDGWISVLNNCLSWYKWVLSNLYHSRQLYNIHLTVNTSHVAVCKHRIYRVAMLLHHTKTGRSTNVWHN